MTDSPIRHEPRHRRRRRIATGSARRADRRRPVARARRAVLLDAARRPRGDRRSRSRAPTATTPARGCLPRRTASSTYFMSINRNKRSIVLDFRDPDDVALVHELFRRADIVIENFKPGGLGEVRPGLRGRTRDQPCADLPLDQRVRHRRGQLAAGLRPRRPGGVGSDEPDRRAGRSRVPRRHLGVRRDDRACTARSACSPRSTSARETGVGQHVEVNLLSSALSGLVNQTGAFMAGGVVPHRMGNEHPSVYPYQTMPTKDRDIIITAANDRQFRSLCEVLGDRRARRRRAVPSQRRPHGEPRRAPPDPRRPPRRVVGRRPVRRAQQGRRAVRPDQLDRRGRRARRAARARTAGDGRGR